MKKAMRVILPILLAIAVIGCIIWYLFVYDRDFTRDMLLAQARFCEQQGNPSLAAWFYNKAYSQSGESDAVAIELAEQYKSGGNYTKAEYVLTNAIADGATSELYIALCKTYVEQDKLLDAVTMLDNVANPEIKAQLDAMRPAVPTASPDPGFYSQYLTVSLEAESGTLYFRTDGEYPTTADAPYAEPISLPGGETVIYALSVADNGLVSPLAIYGYTIGGVVEEVSFADPAVEASIRSQLEADDDRVLYTNELWAITSFTMPEEAETYADLVSLPYLRSLTIENGIAGELHYISALAQLETLTLINCRPSQEDLTAISNLSALQQLTLANCGLSSIEGLSNAQSLVYLDMSNNSIRNITPLSSMAGLQELYLQHNALTDLSALSTLNNLKTLNVSYNSLSSIAPICSIVGMSWLDVSNNSITALGAVDNLTALTHFAAAYNNLTDVSQLASCPELSELDISNNALTDITALAPLVKLTAFDFSYNQVTTLPAWDSSCTLIDIDGSYNLLASLDELGGLPYLNNVYMDYNSDIASVDALADCPMLIQVNVYGTQVSDVSALTAQSVIVNYDPT